MSLTKNFCTVIATVSVCFLFNTLGAQPLSDQSMLIGKVFHDKNGDGIQNAGEDGIPSVRLATVTGLVVETDRYGRFHVINKIQETSKTGNSWGRNIIIKVDSASLPYSSQFTTENPKIIKESQVMERIDFGIQY